MKEQLKGIALILFGTLLCCAESGINRTVLSNFADVPFSFFGLLIGAAGLYFVFFKSEGR